MATRAGVRFCAAFTLLFLAVHGLAAEDRRIEKEVAVGADMKSVLAYTTSGEVLGVADFANNHVAFLGIPFAEDTSGNARWTAPIPRQPWRPFVWNASSPGPACPGDNMRPAANYSEDCLNLNIWAPIANNSALFGGNNDVLFPVMVWIYGGAFVAGYNSDPITTADFFANSTQTVVVEINYRVGPLGFLATPQLTGNYGILDQQLALAWVQENILYFGGDSDRVTIFGQSAGAMSVFLHTVIPSSNGLFSRCIMESNPAGVKYRTLQENLPFAQRFADHVGCALNDTACLRAVGLEMITIVEGALEYLLPTLPLNTKEILLWSPIVDGILLPSQPWFLAEEGKFVDSLEALIIGTNRNETAAFFPYWNLTYSEYDALAAAVFVDDAWAVLAVYPPYKPDVGGINNTEAGEDNFRQVVAVSTDYLFCCAIRFLAARYADAGLPVYLYQFLHVPPADPANGNSPHCRGTSPYTAVCHSAEIPYVFHSDGFVGFEWVFSEFAEDDALSWAMLGYWSDFAHAEFGSNGKATTPRPLKARLPRGSDVALPDWPQFAEGTLQSMAFDMPLSVVTGYRAEYCDFWDAMGYIW